ncbi:hypothetical protein DI09_65p110 [Mitosporidium daphniae]|uniref:AAA+ ATPase domain-containing protein n=1 Tax=Mitosporidium daphniae TaxID=1485682 RepID=A0A098VND2_9MICR|nr:uncharacterized protein DI09_65p110 [Mitosporidium daphniae]KGG50563.1 hypothetical protein DI09_65p110 [Mitosporidium daphniae]|eukprot:XP_013236990.1 uncharacterized protein DI09_65p110 [Mitosporidium daphniae]
MPSNRQKRLYVKQLIPKVHWDDIGGLESAKDHLVKAFSNKDLSKDSSYSRKGVLLHGPPGTGKTLLAKAVATEFSLRFLSVKGPELLDSYVGESERNIRELFKRAKEMAPSLIFFDELDSLAPSRSLSSGGSSSGVMHRLVSQLLSEIDNIPGSNYKLAATNRPDLIDSALLRPGRFDTSIEFGIIRTKEGIFSVLKALTRKYVALNTSECDDRFELGPDSDDILCSLACKVFLPRTGAELYAICSTALLNAINRGICCAKETLIKGNGLLEQTVQINPEFEPIILNGLVAGENCLTKPTFSVSDFVMAAKELEMLIGVIN